MEPTLTLSSEEIAEIIDDYINEKGLWFDFKEWLEKRGYKVQELGLEKNE